MYGSLDIRMREALDFRATLHSSDVALVEDISASAGAEVMGVESAFRLLLPYFGFFAYSAVDRRWLCDSNQTLFISAGRQFRVGHPVSGLGHAGVLITPSLGLLQDVCRRMRPNGSIAFMEVTRPSTLKLQLLTHRLRSLAPEFQGTLAAEELVAHAIDEAFAAAAPKPRRISRPVDRAKEVLHSNGCGRLSLDDIAREAAVSPVYLTQEFTRCEGMPLYQYQLRLRLERALLELPSCDDITGLALDLGFSSHSHFSSTFRKAFGIRPSEYRLSAGSAATPSRLDAMLAPFRFRSRAAA